MESRICPGCGKKVFPADCRNRRSKNVICSHAWECPHDDCDFLIIPVDRLVNIMLSKEVE